MTTTCERCLEHVVPIVDGQAAELCVSCELVEARAEIERLRRLVPNPDDLRTICNVAQYAANTTPTDDPESLAPLLAAVARVRATLEGTE